MRALLMVSLMITFLSACKANKEEAPAAGGETEGAASKSTAAEPAGEAWIAVEKLGVQLQHREGASVMDSAGKSVMISAPDGSCTVMLSPVDETTMHRDYEGTKKEAEKGLTGKIKEWKTDEKTADGWVLYYTKASMLDANKTQHAVDVRKKVEDKEYACARTVDSANEAACVIEACQSLKAL